MIWHLALFAAISFVGAPTARRSLDAWNVAFALPQLDALAWRSPRSRLDLRLLCGLFGSRQVASRARGGELAQGGGMRVSL